MIDERQEITRKDLDDLVKLSETDPSFKKTFQELDVLANKRGVPLAHVIETAIALYQTKKRVKEWNENRYQ